MNIEVVLFIVNALLGMVIVLVSFTVKRLYREVDMLREKTDELIKEIPQNYSTKGDIKYMIDLLIEKMDRWETKVENLIDKMYDIKRNQQP